MSVASVREAPASWMSPVTVVVGGDARTRHRAAKMLDAAGFGVLVAPAAEELEGREHPVAGTLIVLLGQATSAGGARVRAIADARPDAMILVVMSGSARQAALRRVLVAGATGIVLDDQLDRALVPTARAMLAGQLAVPVGLARQIAPRPLSHREKQILALVVLGLTNREIAGRLYLAESTIKTHLSSAFRKLDARSRSEAVARIQDPETNWGPSVLALAADHALPATS